jgi:hypothetical protein
VENVRHRVVAALGKAWQTLGKMWAGRRSGGARQGVADSWLGGGWTTWSGGARQGVVDTRGVANGPHEVVALCTIWQTLRMI